MPKHNLPAAAMMTLVIVAAVGLTGCESASLWWNNPADFEQPTVAVMSFENRAPVAVGWNLSDGMADVLVDRLMATKRFHVVERGQLKSVMQELKLQQGNLTRPQEKASPGRLKNVQYLIKATITDFGHVSTTDGFFGSLGWVFAGGKAKAVMSMTLYVIDVESGEIVTSTSFSESVATNDVDVKATYKGIAFGGSGFYSTPLGRVTATIIDKAVKRITIDIASRRWEPHVAAVQADGNVILNGGCDRQLKVGQEFQAFQAGEPIFDPKSGDLLGHQSGRTCGLIRIISVEDRFCVAQIVEGAKSDFAVGQLCRPAGR